MKRALQVQYPALKNNHEDHPSSDEEREQFSSDEEEEDDIPDQEGLHEELDTENELKNIENRVKEVNDAVKQSETVKKGKVSNPLKVLVSKKKRRFNLEGFNLDLTYVTPNIIAMGFPAEKMESIYRNSMTDVKQFFTTRHPSQYRVYNLCAEPKYQYNAAHFEGNVGSFGCYDHQAPPIKQIFAFCDDMKAWLSEDPKSISAVHCKAGKGRTGVMICCYLIYSKYCKNALEALRYYGYIRTKNKKGVTIPSQIRYVYYFEQALQLGWNVNCIPSVTIVLRKIKVHTIPKMGLTGGCSPYFCVENICEDKDSTLFDSRKNFPIKSYKSEAYIEYASIQQMKVTGDVLIVFYHKKLLGKDKKMFQVWFNTSFLSSSGILTIENSMIDKVHKDKSFKKFNKDFKLEIQYDILKGTGLTMI